ncbi:MAG: tRNA (adenosine(37)-N6)-dimethylallyltransferase MiaA [Candidatus Falkowbacteria bacterium]
MKKTKVVVILGCTASGKTGLGIKLADLFGGEIISADSRQVFKGMNVGSGKDLKDYVNAKIPYHLIDVVKPNTKFSLAKYQRLAEAAINDIWRRGKLPLIVGGTGLYLQAVIEDYKLADVKTDFKKREELEALSLEELFSRLNFLSPEFATRLNNSDLNNKRRLARYIEIFSQDADFAPRKFTANTKYDFLLIGIDWPMDVLEGRIRHRLMERLEKEDMIGEVKQLHQDGVSWKRLEGFGLEYKYVSWYLQGKMDYEDMVEKLNTAIRQFAKKQKSWWKRWEKQGAKINWVNDFLEAKDLVKGFVK